MKNKLFELKMYVYSIKRHVVCIQEMFVKDGVWSIRKVTLETGEKGKWVAYVLL